VANEDSLASWEFPYLACQMQEEKRSWSQEVLEHQQHLEKLPQSSCVGDRN